MNEESKVQSLYLRKALVGFGVCFKTAFKRGLDTGLLVLLSGPPLGGFGFGIVQFLYSIVEVVAGRETAIHGLNSLLGIPLFLIGAFLVPAAWLGSLVAAFYAAFRVGITGRMTLVETVILAAISAAVINARYPSILPSAFNWALTACALFAAMTLRYITGKVRLRKG